MSKHCLKMNTTCQYYDICNSELIISDKECQIIEDFKKMDLELISFLATDRKIIKKEFIPEAEVDNVILKYEKYGLVYKKFKYQSDSNSKDSYNNIDSCYPELLKENNNFIIAGENLEDINRYIKYEDSDAQRQKQRITIIGHYLGYPKCCVRMHLNRVYDGDDFNELKCDQNWDKLKMKKKYVCPLVNSHFPLNRHYFCDYTCQNTYKKAIEVLQFLSENVNSDFPKAYISFITSNK